jgi:hypothetical protein
MADSAAGAPDAARACYVYGIVPARAALPADARGVGDPAGEVSLVRHGQVAAVVSDVPRDRALGTRGDLLRHSQLLDGIAASVPVLPMRFGAVLSDARAVADELLAPNHDHFAEVLSDLDGRAQFTVKARYVEEAVLREVLAEEPEIMALHEALRDRPVEASHFDRIRLGELIARAVERRRQADTWALVDELAPYAAAVACAPAASAEDVMVDAAFLVDREGWPAFERAVEGIAQRGAERIRLRLLGPLAPYDFVADLTGEG